MRKYETAESFTGFDGADVSVRWQVIGGASEDRLRSQRELRPIQKLFMGTGEDARPLECRSNQECREFRLGGKGLDPSGFGRRRFDHRHGDHSQSADPEY